MTGSENKLIDGKATPRGAYPHIKRVGDYIFISGTSSRLPDNSFAGVQKVDAMGTMSLDIKQQTKAVLDNISDYLIMGEAGDVMNRIVAELENI